MNYLKKRDWELREDLVTDEELFNNRREFLKLGAALAVSTSTVMELAASEYSLFMGLGEKKKMVLFQHQTLCTKKTQIKMGLF